MQSQESNQFCINPNSEGILDVALVRGVIISARFQNEKYTK